MKTLRTQLFAAIRRPAQRHPPAASDPSRPHFRGEYCDHARPLHFQLTSADEPVRHRSSGEVEGWSHSASDRRRATDRKGEQQCPAWPLLQVLTESAKSSCILVGSSHFRLAFLDDSRFVRLDEVGIIGGRVSPACDRCDPARGLRGPQMTERGKDASLGRLLELRGIPLQRTVGRDARLSPACYS